MVPDFGIEEWCKYEKTMHNSKVGGFGMEFAQRRIMQGY
jgi:hypothetical protein